MSYAKGTVTIYGLGGTGFNCAEKFYGLDTTEGNSLEGYADIRTYFIDTSLSNIIGKNNRIKEEDTYILEGVDGSGKFRAENYDALNKSIKPILHKFKPSEFNIILASASGGTGSLASSLLAKELSERNIPYVVILVGSEESKITIENTVKTLQSFDVISRNLKKPILISYHHNCVESPRAKNDEVVKQVVTALSILTSRENRELDTADVANFIGFEKVTSVKEGVTFLYVSSKEEDAAKIQYPISTASLFSQEGKTATLLTPEYSCVGYPLTNVLDGVDLHFVTSQYDVGATFSRLHKRLDEFNESSSARVSSNALGGNSDDNGIVL